MSTAKRDRFGALRARGVILAILSFLAATLLGGAPAHAATLKSADSKLPKVLRVGTEGTYAPFDFQSGGKLTGYDIDYFNALAKKLNVKVEWVQIPWDSMFASLDSGRIDIIADQVTQNAARQAKYDLSDTYVKTTGVVVTKSSNNSIKSVTDLKGKTAAESMTSNWTQVAKSAGAKIASVDGLDQAAALVSQGRADAFVNDQLGVKYYLATHSNSGLKIVSTTNDVSNSVYAAKKNSGYMTAINAGIKELNADGTSAKIYDKYFKSKVSGTSSWSVIKSNLWPMIKAVLTATIPLTIISFIIGLVLALGVALARMSSNIALSWIARAFISIFRGTPLLVQLFIVFFGLPQIGIKLSPWPSAIIAFSLNVAAYSAEIIRSALLSVPKGQWEAAETIGMNRQTALRRIILPQASRVAVPPLSNTLISLVKDTSLASTILVTEMFRNAQIAAAPSGDFLQLYAVAAVIYWIICFVLSIGQGRLENRLGRYVAK